MIDVQVHIYSVPSQLPDRCSAEHARHWSKLDLEGIDAPIERISIDPRICHGQACVKGTRIPVHQIVHMLANGDTVEDLLSEYPSLTREDVLLCLESGRR
jgi:uncharacterized protein (DUF433 family)